MNFEQNLTQSPFDTLKYRAKQGHADAQFSLGCMFDEGDGV